MVDLVCSYPLRASTYSPDLHNLRALFRLGTLSIGLFVSAAQPVAADFFVCATPHLAPSLRVARPSPLISGAARSAQASRTAQVAPNVARGSYNALVLFARFADEAVGDNRKPLWADDLFDSALPGSFTHFYDEMSRGQLSVAGDVAAKRYVSLSPRANYIAAEAGTFGDYGRFNLEILEQADEDIDLGLFDNEGPDGVPNSGDDDGYVDVLFINLLTVPRDFFIGGATGLASLGLLTDFLSDDAASGGGVIRVRSQFSGFGGTTQRGHVFSVTASTMCHEFAHVLGLPDLFDQSTVTASGQVDPAVDSAGIGKWGLMGLGTLGWGVEDGPNAFSAWSLARLGWLGIDNSRLVELNGSSPAHPLRSIDDDGQVLRISMSEDEYFLIENRQAQDSYYNRNVPGEGLLLWHVDDRADNDEERHKQVDLVCADGLYADQGFPGQTPDPVGGGDNLDFWARDASYATAHNGNQGDATDPFDGITNTRFDADSNPGARVHSGFRRGTKVGLVLENIRPLADGSMRVDVLLRQPVPGNVSEDTHWSGVVDIDGDVVVEPGVTLTLDPGVEVRFAAGDARAGGFSAEKSELLVYGELVVEASSGAPARLRSPDTSWLGVLVLDGGSASIEEDVATGRLLVEDADLGVVRARLPVGITRWSGTRRVPWDLTIPAGARLVVEGGTQVAFAPVDLSASGRHPELTEWIVEGELIIDGLMSPVALQVDSRRSDDLWYGIRLVEDGVLDMQGASVRSAGFGVQGTVTPAGSARVIDSQFSRLVNGLSLILFDDALIAGSAFSSISGAAIAAGGSATLRLRNTTIEGVGQEGILMSNASLEAINTTVTDNGLLDASDPRSGVFAEGGAGQRLDMWDSVVESNRAHGIDAHSWGGIIELHRTCLSSNRANGVYANGAERVVFEDIELSRNLGRGADLSATSVEMWTTTATNNVAGGARVGGGSRVVVDMSHFTGNGLLLSETDQATVRNSEFESTGVALDVFDAAPQIVSNLFLGNTTAIRVDGSVVPTSISDNTFTGNATAIENLTDQTLSATGNYWGTVDSSAIEDLLSGPIDFSGFLDGGPVATAIGQTQQTPVRTTLLGSWPNPFNSRTLISFSLATTTSVSLSIYDITGQRVWYRPGGVALGAGVHEIAWDGSDTAGRQVATGVYIYHLKTSTERVGVGRVLLLR
jgi:M6 family metalloprotease-like protein